MSELYRFYLPTPDEPSVFTNRPGVVNNNWIEASIKRVLGLAIDRGSKNFDALAEFFETSTVQITKDNFIRDMNPESFRKRIGYQTVEKLGQEIQKQIRTDLEKGLPPDLFDEPTSICTASGAVSLRWVLYTANMDNMPPEEAYTYALGLIK